MKIAQVCNYKAPAFNQMGAERIVERLTKGLIGLGHDVTMFVEDGSTCPVSGATINEGQLSDCDVLHFHGWEPHKYERHGVPWVTTIHGYRIHQHQELAQHNPHIVGVSNFASRLIGATQHVWNCSDPQEFEYSKLDGPSVPYFVWMAGTDWGEQKGLFTTLSLARRMRIRLKIAGTGNNLDTIEAIQRQTDNRIEYLGAVNGQDKVRLLQNAQALILLTQLPDACPVTVSEALMCGTPVIGSNQGSLPEIIKDKETGFICKNVPEVMAAVAKINLISRQACRDYALQHFSIETCAKRYVNIYENVIKQARQQRSSVAQTSQRHHTPQLYFES